MLKKVFSHTFEEHKNSVDKISHGNLILSIEKQKGVDPNGKGGGEELRGVGEGKL